MSRDRPRRRRFALASLTIAAVVATLSGCSAPPRTESIRFFLAKAEAIPFFTERIAEFNAAQDEIRVVLDSTSNLQAGFVRGGPPDLALHSYNTETARFLERGELSDLADLPEADRIRPDLQGLIDQYATYPGRTSVLPYSVMAASVIYDRDVFARYGLRVPQTWDELLAVCDALEAAGVTPFYATFKDPWTIAQGWFDYAAGGAVDTGAFYSALRAEGAAVGPDAATSFESAFAAPVDRMLRLARDYTNPDADSRGYAEGNAAMASGQAAMYLQGPWALSQIALARPEAALGSFPLPMTADPADLRIRVNLDLAAWIPESSPHRAAARRFLSFLFQQEVMDAYNASQLGFGTTEDAAPVTDPRILEMKPYYDAGRVYQGASQQIPRTIPFENYLQGVLLGGDPAQALRTTDADWSRLAMRR